MTHPGEMSPASNGWKAGLPKMASQSCDRETLNQRENVVFSPVLAHQSGRQPQPAAGLQPSRHLEHGGR